MSVIKCNNNGECDTCEPVDSNWGTNGYGEVEYVVFYECGKMEDGD